jgi:hypothetical protein
MRPLNVTYRDRIAWLSRSNNTSNRPFCRIRVHSDTGSGGKDLWGLLDTGADYLMLDKAVAHSLKIDLNNCLMIPVTLASGMSVLMPLIKKVNVTIRGKRVPVDAIFGITGIPLIGRTAILAAIDFGIDIDGWLYRAF